MLEHYLRSSVSFFCCGSKLRRKIVKKIDKQCVQALRELPSCIKLMESMSEEQQQNLEKDNDAFMVRKKRTNLLSTQESPVFV